MLRLRLLGVKIVVHWSWLLVLALLAWSLAGTVFPGQYPGLRGTAYAAMGLAGSVLLFASVLVHELCHTLVTRHDGVEVRQIRLFLFGGASESTEPPPSPIAEFRAVAAGPISTAALTLLFLLGVESGRAAGAPVEVTGVLDYLWRLNALLLGFNLLPALPLDGGRLVHAWKWHRTGDSARATLSAGRAGQVLGVGLLALGVLAASGGAVGGIWLVMIGGFLLMSVRQEVQAARAVVAYGDLTVADIMATDLVTLRPEMTVADLADLLRYVPSHPVYPVAENGRLAGLLELRTAGRVPLERRPDVSLRDLMLTGPAAPTVRPGLSAREAAGFLEREPGRAAVLDGDRLIGLVSRSDLARVITGQAIVTPGSR